MGWKARSGAQAGVGQYALSGSGCLPSGKFQTGEVCIGERQTGIRLPVTVSLLGEASQVMVLAIEAGEVHFV